MRHRVGIDQRGRRDHQRDDPRGHVATPDRRSGDGVERRKRFRSLVVGPRQQPRQRERRREQREIAQLHRMETRRVGTSIADHHVAAVQQDDERDERPDDDDVRSGGAPTRAHEVCQLVHVVPVVGRATVVQFGNAGLRKNTTRLHVRPVRSDTFLPTDFDVGKRGRATFHVGETPFGAPAHVYGGREHYPRDVRLTTQHRERAQRDFQPRAGVLVQVTGVPQENGRRGPSVRIVEHGVRRVNHGKRCHARRRDRVCP